MIRRAPRSERMEMLHRVDGIARPFALAKNVASIGRIFRNDGLRPKGKAAPKKVQRT